MPEARRDSERPDAESSCIQPPSYGRITLALESCAGFSIFATDPAGAITLWSDGACRLYGYQRHEIIGQSLSVLHAEAEAAGSAIEEMFVSARRLGSWEGPVERVGKDGGHFTARVSTTPVWDTDGSLEGYLFVSSDVSDEATLREQLEDERQYERSLFDASADAMVIVDDAGTIVRANAALEKTFGYDRAELVGQPVEMLLPARYRDQHAERRADFSSQPTAREMAAGLNFAGRRKDGVELSLEIRLTPHGSEKGMLVTAEIRDITDRLRAEADLEAARRETVESLTLLETLQSTAPVGFGFVDRDLRIRNANARLAAIRGGRPQDMIGRTVQEAVPHLWPQIESAYQHVAVTGEPVINLEVEGEDASSPGVRSWLTSLYPVCVDGEMIGMGVATSGRVGIAW